MAAVLISAFPSPGSLSVLFNSVKRTESYLFFKLLAYVTKECAELKFTHITSFKKCEDLLCSSSYSLFFLETEQFLFLAFSINTEY